jgi:pimeloyl-ACP methyl ester carboxylesterase
MTRRQRFPARLTAAAAMAAALLAGVLAATPQAASSAATNPDCGPMQHVLDASGQPVPPVNAMQPVLLVHGFNETPAVWDGNNGLAAQLDAPGSGFFVGRFDYSYAPGLNQDWITDPRIAGPLAQVIDCMAQESRSAGGDGKVIVIGASMGGLALQQALAEQVSGRNVASEVGGLVSLGTPWQGADPNFDTLTKVIEDKCVASLLNTADPPVAAAGDVCVAGLLKLGIASQAGPAMLPATGGGPSAAIQKLPKIPPHIPVLAVAGNMRWTDQRLDQTQIYQGSDGVVSVTSAISPPFESGTGSGPLTKVVDPCVVTSVGAVPVHSKGPAQSFSSHLPLCFHVTLPIDPHAADQIVPVLQQWRGTLLAAAAKARCTRSAMTSAVAPAMNAPTMGGVQWSVGAYACQDGYALVDINVVTGLPPVAVLKLDGASWKLVFGPREDLCLAPPDPQECPNHQLPLPLPVLNALEAAITSQQTAPASPPPSVSPSPSSPLPDFYYANAVLPETLYVSPTYPKELAIDNHDGIAIQAMDAWSPTSMTMTGVLSYDECRPDCAAGPTVTFPAQVVATAPHTCTLQVDQQGSTLPEKAYVYSDITVKALSGNPPAQLVGNSVFKVCNAPRAQSPPIQQSPAPFAVTSSSPTSGPASGGTLIVIHGSGFSSVTKVVMNSTEPPLPEGNPNYYLQNLHPRFSVVSDSEIDVTTAAGAAGFTYEIDFITPTHGYFSNTFPGIPLFTYK